MPSRMHYLEPRRPRRGLSSETRRASFAEPTEPRGRRVLMTHPGQACCRPSPASVVHFWPAGPCPLTLRLRALLTAGLQGKAVVPPAGAGTIGRKKTNARPLACHLLKVVFIDSSIAASTGCRPAQRGSDAFRIHQGGSPRAVCSTHKQKHRATRMRATPL
jgi:hypothetical protein